MRVVKVCGKALTLLTKRAVTDYEKLHLLPINWEMTACRKSFSYFKSAVRAYAKFIHFVFLESFQQSFDTDEYILQLLFCISSNDNSKDSNITELDMNYQS